MNCEFIIEFVASRGTKSSDSVLMRDLDQKVSSAQLFEEGSSVYQPFSGTGYC